MTEIFYPNQLTSEDLTNLEPWQLKVAGLHFGFERDDYVQANYGYAIDSEEGTIYIVEQDHNEMEPFSLADEIDWEDPFQLLFECDPLYVTSKDISNWQEMLRNHVAEKLSFKL